MPGLGEKELELVNCGFIYSGKRYFKGSYVADARICGRIGKREPRLKFGADFRYPD